MSSHPPPAPSEQQSDVIRGEHSPPERHAEVKHDPAGGTADVNLSEQGQTADTIQNTTPQARQQDR